MKFSQTLPPSRRGKKQLITYVEPDIADRVVELRREQGKTKQEIVADAMNAFFRAHNRTPVFPGGHQRVIERNRGLAKARAEDKAAACRSGKFSVAGWFDPEPVRVAKAFAEELNIPLQDMLKFGILHVTGASPLPMETID